MINNRSIIKTTVLIIGAGPAGCSSAIQLKRTGVDFILIEKSEVGGLARNANLIENYPGFIKGISGYNFVSLLSKNLQVFGIVPKKDEIKELKYDDELFFANGIYDNYISDYIILASGTNYITPENVLISEPAKDRIFFEIKELQETNDCKICIIGSGDAAFDYALNLSEKNSKVDIYIRSDYSKALKLLQQRVADSGKITIHFNHLLSEITENRESVRLVFETPGGIKVLNYDFVIFAIGRKANDSFLNIDNITKNELILKKRLFPVGDVLNNNHRQCIIAAGDGNFAACEIYEKNLNGSYTKNG